MSKRKFESSSASEDNLIQGYIHVTNDVKKARNTDVRYFDGTIQISSSEFVRFVNFSPESVDSFQSAMTMKTPVKLQNVRLTPKDGRKEITFGHRSSIEICRKLDFSRKTEVSKPTADLTNISAITSPQMTISIKAKMCGFIENKKQIDTRYGKRNIRTAFVADTSGTIKLVLWEENIDKVVQGEFYRIENVLSSSFKGSIQLTTTQQTTFHTIEPLINVKEDFEHLEILETTYMGKVDYCTFKTQYKCLHCQRALTEGPGEDTKQSTTVKCASCGVKQRYSTEQMMSQIKFQFSTVDGKKLNMVMFSNEIEKFKYDNNLMQKSNDEVEDFLLCQACMTIKTNADSDIVNTCTIQLQ